MARLLAALLIALTLTMPAYAGTIVSTGKLNALKQGQSSVADVKAALGEPESQDHNPDGGLVFMYRCDLPNVSEKGGASLKGVIVVGFDASGKFSGISIFPDGT